MINIFQIRHLITNIINYDGDVVVCGLSTTTKLYLEKYNLLPFVNYIFDNGRELDGKKHESICIINYGKLKTLVNPLVIIWGNHNCEYFQQIKSLKFRAIMEFNNNLSQNQNLSFLLEPSFTFIVETPNFLINGEHNSNHNFPKMLISKLLLLDKNIQTKIVYINEKNCKEPRVINKNEILFSYHSLGNNIKNIIRYKDSYLYNSILLSAEGYSGWNKLLLEDDECLKGVSKTDIDQFYQSLYDRHVKNNFSKYTQAEDVNYQFPEKFVFFPLQTLNDTVMEHSYFKPIELIKKIINILDKSHIPLVIKIHPRCQNVALKKLLLEYERKSKVFIYSGSIHLAISKATTIYTINSGVGFEALLHLKPVITFGKSDYMHMTKNIADLQKIKKMPLYQLTEIKKSLIKRQLFSFLKQTTIFLENENEIDLLINRLLCNYLGTSNTFLEPQL